MKRDIIKVDDNLIKDIEILRLKINALYELFISYMNDQFEIYNEFKLEKFMNEYSTLCAIYESMISGIIYRELGAESYRNYSDNCVRKNTWVDFPNKEITIVWPDWSEENERTSGE